MVMASSKFSFHRRLFFGLLVYTTAIIVGFAIYHYQREKDFKVRELDTELQGVNVQVLQSLAHGLTPDSAAHAASSRIDNLRISIISKSGKVLYDNTLDTLPGSNHLDREEIAQALKSGSGYTIRRHSASTGQTYFYSAEASNGYVVRTAVPYSISLARALSPETSFLWILLAITAVMLLLGYLATRRLGKHISRLSNFASKAERGERITDTEAFPNDEIGQVSHNIVRLYARLQQALADRDREQAKALKAMDEQNRIKRQLTNNINHELKTPVASIRICLETLREHPDLPEEKRRELIDRCYDASQRLAQLLADVGTIARLEDGASSITCENVILRAIVAEVCDEYRLRADAAGFTIENDISFDSELRGNAALLGSVFRNLISNAIAYSGGNMISLTQKVSTDHITITVADNGSGVPPEHLPHLFERFYRIDKGRSRAAGGTGLGLSIVKNAIHWHNGTITIRQPRHSGLTFTITLPLPTTHP